MLPIENSDLGTIRRGLDKLVQQGPNKFHVVGETYEREKHCLCALPKTALSDVRAITSHVVALEQCSEYISRLKRQCDDSSEFQLVVSDDTVAACQRIRKKNLKHTAAIASAKAAEANGLSVLVKDIANDVNNETRFLILAPDPRVPSLSVNAKTSLVFAFSRDEPGLLFKALSCFSLRDINVLQVGMRPAARASHLMSMKPHWEYITYVDVEGSTCEERVQNALRHLREMTSALTVLGSYPRGYNRRLEAKQRRYRSESSALLCQVGGM